MSHLGTRISALVDGQLSVAATERALAHVAACPQCADELAAAREAHARLWSCADDVPTPADLTARLLSLASSDDAPAPPPVRDPFAVPPGVSLPSHGLSHGLLHRGGALHGDVAARRGPSRLLVGSVAGLGALAAMLFVLGDRPVVVPSGHSAVDLDLLGRSIAAGDDGSDEVVVVHDTAVDELRAQGWTFPDTLPDGWAVTGTRWIGTDASVLEIDLTGPAGKLVVTEQIGRLDTAALAGAETFELDGREAYVLSYEPWHVAWQCGQTVVQVVAPRADETTGAVVAAFPRGAYDDGVPARLSRGWATVAGALDVQP
ncbi:anti-sigma factor family protein [Cellulomonas composti]|uniref:Uncharacterized protein n=1 Tax=Cellulomonas composti TaxID=266130 RepID=A0A511JCG3_9CELL|nr:zf-HC2 domain-containing protein [Cellulomonas composti]GEL95691.1 hypothetical protein CCO02nite_23490 [Cellulomonas composti]